VEGELIHPSGYYDYKVGLSNKHHLSRNFCNLMCRQQIATVEPELDQIGAITGLDISLFYRMLLYKTDPDEIDHYLSFAETEEERQKILQQIEDDKAALRGNLPRVSNLVNALLLTLAPIEDLPSRLDHGDRDTLNSPQYFADFTPNPGDGYIDNNFGQDLGNFKRFLEYARDQGLNTVYFSMG